MLQLVVNNPVFTITRWQHGTATGKATSVSLLAALRAAKKWNAEIGDNGTHHVTNESGRNITSELNTRFLHRFLRQLEQMVQQPISN